MIILACIESNRYPPTSLLSPAAAGCWCRRRRATATTETSHLFSAVIQAVGGLLHWHAPQQAVAAQRIQGAVPTRTQHTLPFPNTHTHSLSLTLSQPGRPEETAGEDKEQQAVDLLLSLAESEEFTISAGKSNSSFHLVCVHVLLVENTLHLDPNLHCATMTHTLNFFLSYSDSTHCACMSCSVLLKSKHTQIVLQYILIKL